MGEFPNKATQFSSENQPENNGRPKGSKSLSTIIRELEAEDFDWSLVPVKQKEAMIKIGSPWRAITFTAVAKAASGDTRAMEWLRKSGYGDKMDITSGGKPIPILGATTVQRNDSDNQDKESKKED